MKTQLALVGLLCWCFSPSLTRADSVQQVTKEIKIGSVLTLRNDVAEDLAENLLAAQQAAYYTAFEPDSLQLSIDAVLRAIALEQSFGLRYCDDYNCQIVWQQSNIAIDDRVSITFNTASLNFGAVAVTPEPTTWVLMGGGFLALVLSKLFMGGWRGPKNI